MASFVIAFPVRVFDEEFYLLSNDSINFLPFKLSIRLGWCFGGALAVRWEFKRLVIVFMVFWWQGDVAKFLRSDHSDGISALSLRLR